MVSLKKDIWIKILLSIYIQLFLFIGFKALVANLGNQRANYYSESGGHIQEAIQHYKRVLFIDKKNIYALIWCGYAFEDLHDSQKAGEYYDQAIKYHPESDQGFYYKGLLAVRKRNYREAEKLFRQAVINNGKYKNQSQNFLDIFKQKEKIKDLNNNETRK